MQTTMEENVDFDFDLDITLIEQADTASLVANTDNGCGSTCGACVSNA